MVKRVANVALILLMTLSVYSHYMVNDRFERLAPALVRDFYLSKNFNSLNERLD